MTDTTSMSARDSIAGSASLFAELLDNRSEEAVPPGNNTLDNLTKIVNDEVSSQFIRDAHRDKNGKERYMILQGNVYGVPTAARSFWWQCGLKYIISLKSTRWSLSLPIQLSLHGVTALESH